jgi:hypothetical protein
MGVIFPYFWFFDVFFTNIHYVNIPKAANTDKSYIKSKSSPVFNIFINFYEQFKNKRIQCAEHI